MARLPALDRRLRVAAVVLLLLVASVAPNLSTAAGPAAAAPGATTASSLGPLPFLHATRGDLRGIFDDLGRQVILRGVNLNSLGDYYQANAAYPTTVPVTAADWDLMAAQGFNSVRLLVSWSRLEPSPGTIDGAYLAEVHQAVADAAARGIYSVIDMHQDAYGKFIASPPGVVCGPGLSPAIGWDGAPDWATITDGADTCRGGSREDSEAVRTAWDSFWADRDGIQTHLVQVWARLATEFAGDPNVAGFDLLNEPGYGHASTDTKAALASYYARTIAAIRQAEAASGVGGPGHVVFFEYTVDGEAVPPDFSADTNLVFAPHVYGGSIAPLTVEQNWAYAASLGDGYQTALWSGEYGWFSDPAANQPKLATFGHIEDDNLAGSAWWQWRQACGDPHSIGTPGGVPGDQIQYQYNACPGDVNGGVVPEWRTIVGRPYPRGLPGRIIALSSDGPDATLDAYGEVTADTDAAHRTFLVWVPDRGTGTPSVGGDSVADVRVEAVTGGFLATGTVCGTGYHVRVGPDAVGAPATCPAQVPVSPTPPTGPAVTVPPGGALPATGSTGTSAPAAAVEFTPAFTG